MTLANNTVYQMKISDYWLLARHDATINLSSFSQCMCFGDIFDSSTNELIIADFSQYFKDIHSNLEHYEFKIKTFKGIKIINEISHLEAPAGIIIFKCKGKDKIILDLAVASGPYIYVYRKLSPYYKYILPSLQPQLNELQLWEQAREGNLTAEELREKLEELKCELYKFTSRSIRYHQLPSNHLQEFFNTYRVIPLEKQTVATCLSKMSKQYTGPNSWDCLIVGTESCFVYIYDCVSHNNLCQFSLPSVPVHLNAVGSYDIDYHILVTCRDGRIYSIKRGEMNANLYVDAESQIIGLVRTNKAVIVACMDQTVKGFSLQGRPVWRVIHSCEILTIIPMNLISSNNRNHEIYYILCLSDGSVHVYCDQHLCDTCITWIPSIQNNDTNNNKSDLSTNISSSNLDSTKITVERQNKNQSGKLIDYHLKKPDPIVACCFGKYDREVNTLVLISQGGHMFILIAKRSANFIPINVIQSNTIGKLNSLNIPKKSKLFMDLTTREQLNAPQMYRQFMRDLCFIKRSVESNFLKMLQNHSNPIPIAGFGEQIKLNVQVQGLGPDYTLICEVVQIKDCAMSIVKGLYIIILFNASVYHVDPVLIPVATIFPCFKYRYTAAITLIHETIKEEEIKVLVINNKSSDIIVTSSVKMPVSNSSIECV
ncbi:Bardet-Biedl syndrome 1 protein like [Schistosoma japonicum]|nr:Bardet-Biedl syndrome 1 protein like [Schistosoma japonicum]